MDWTIGKVEYFRVGEDSDGNPVWSPYIIPRWALEATEKATDAFK